MNSTWSPPTRHLVAALIILALITIGWTVREMFQPLAIAGLAAYLLNPLVNLLKRRLRASHRLAANLVFFFSLVLLLAIPASILPFLLAQIEDLVSDLVHVQDQVRLWLVQPLSLGGFTLYWNWDLPDFRRVLDGLVAGLPEHGLEWLERTSRNAAWLLVIVVSIYYLLLDGGRLREWGLRQVPEPYRRDARRLLLQVKKVWASYLRGTLMLMVIVAAVFSVVWLVIGLPGAIAIGILTGLLSIIPEVGPLAATLLALFVALVEGSRVLPISNLWFALLVVAIYAVLINLKNIWLRPRIMGRSVHMHEGVVFVAIIAAVVFWGILGALLIVPLLASAAVLGRYLRRRVLGLPPFAPRPARVPRPAPPAAAALRQGRARGKQA
jgi:predicted PurR-regulated permease PerM